MCFYIQGRTTSKRIFGMNQKPSFQYLLKILYNKQPQKQQINRTNKKILMHYPELMSNDERVDLIRLYYWEHKKTKVQQKSS